MRANNKKKIALHSTILSGNTELVRGMIKSYKDVNYLDESHNAPLHIAAIKGYVEIVRILIRNRAKINVSNHHGSTPLHLALQFNNTSAALELIEEGANINAKDRYGETPLHIAVSKNNMLIVKVLIERGAQINAINSVSLTPLAIAIKKSNPIIAEILQNAGAVIPKGFIETAQNAFKSANIFRKIIFFALMVSVFVTAGVVSYLKGGSLIITSLLAVTSTIGALLVCFITPYQRIKALEKRVLNELMTQEEVDKLLLLRAKDVDNKGIFLDSTMNCEASNDNIKFTKSIRYKKIKKSKKIC